jgi:Na+-translocating ferredoxin:NAD+ oxidoreductase RNF subunit RnfB
MAEKKDIKEKIKKIHDVLPKLDDQRCGYRTCGEFARAIAEGKAPCYGCVSGGPDVGAKVCEIMGARVPEVAIPQFFPSPGFYQPGFPGGRGVRSGMGRGIGQGMGRGLGGGRGMDQGRGMGSGGGMGRGFGRCRRGR